MKYIKINKRKGWTLIESIMIIGIFFMLVGGVLLSTNKILKYENTLEVESCKNDILTFINRSKLYCKNKVKAGDIVFDTTNKEIKLKIGMKYIDKISLPKDFILKDIVRDGKNIISIDKYGFINDACTISFLDKFKNKSDITVCVGTGYVEIK